MKICIKVDECRSVANVVVQFSETADFTEGMTTISNTASGEPFASRGIPVGKPPPPYDASKVANTFVFTPADMPADFPNPFCLLRAEVTVNIEADKMVLDAALAALEGVDCAAYTDPGRNWTSGGGSIRCSSCSEKTGG